MPIAYIVHDAQTAPEFLSFLILPLFYLLLLYCWCYDRLVLLANFIPRTSWLFILLFIFLMNQRPCCFLSCHPYMTAIWFCPRQDEQVELPVHNCCLITNELMIQSWKIGRYFRINRQKLKHLWRCIFCPTPYSVDRRVQGSRDETP